MIFSIGVGFFYTLLWRGAIGCVRIDIGFIYLYIHGKIGVDMPFFVTSNNNLFHRTGWEIKSINPIPERVFVRVTSSIRYFPVHNSSLSNFWSDSIYPVCCSLTINKQKTASRIQNFYYKNTISVYLIYNFFLKINHKSYLHYCKRFEHTDIWPHYRLWLVPSCSLGVYWYRDRPHSGRAEGVSGTDRKWLSGTDRYWWLLKKSIKVLRLLTDIQSN